MLTRTFPPAINDPAIEATGKAERRSRLFPALPVVYCVLGLALFNRSGYGEVMRSLAKGLSWENRLEDLRLLPSPRLLHARRG